MAHAVDLLVSPIRRARGRVELPGSKSISNRALLLAALAVGTSRIERLLEADDTRVMIDALLALGVDVTSAGGTTVVVGSGGRFPNARAKLFLGNAGTAMRPLAAALAFAGGEFELDGVARMRERPIGDLVDALRELGASIAYLGREGYPPLALRPARPLETDTVEIRGDVSSQFVSSLLMAAPGIAPPGGLSVRVPGALISQPYVSLTVRLLERFGISVVRSDDRTFRVPPGTYRSPGPFVVEGDASSASYFLALGVLTGGPVRVLGVGESSIQGDVAFTRILEAAGGRVAKGSDWIEAASGAPLRAFDIDCTDIPDAAMTGAVVAAFAEGRSVLRGIGSWRVKETDRIAAMATELRKVGAHVEEGPDWIAVTGPTAFREASVATYDDHRMAMSMALVAASGVPVRIQDPGCVAKTFPDYFARLAGLVGEDAA
jgi:3-phosphoshikimate 1-carboxyvinyltransferase